MFNGFPSRNKNKSVFLKESHPLSGSGYHRESPRKSVSVPDPCDQVPNGNLLWILHKHHGLNMPTHSTPHSTPQSDSLER